MKFSDFSKKKVCAIDFDGVIHSYHDGYRNGEIYGYVLPGAKESIDKLKKKYKIIIYTARVYDDKEALNRVKQWLKKNDIYFDEVKEKIIADLYIDDNAVRCAPLKGVDWDAALEEVEKIRGI